VSVGADVELLGLYWTVSGPVEVHYGREWSLFSWADRCAEARTVGFSGLGLWHADIRHLLETQSLAELKEIFDDSPSISATSRVALSLRTNNPALAGSTAPVTIRSAPLSMVSAPSFRSNAIVSLPDAVQAPP